MLVSKCHSVINAQFVYIELKRRQLSFILDTEPFKNVASWHGVSWDNFNDLGISPEAYRLRFPYSFGITASGFHEACRSSVGSLHQSPVDYP